MRVVIALIIFPLLTALSIYMFLPTLAYGFTGFSIYLVVISIITAGILVGNTKKGLKKNYLVWFPLSVALLCIIYVIIFPIFTTWAMFHSEAYRNLIGEVKVSDDFSKRVAPISNEKIRVVDQAVARRLGDKVLGSNPALGSQAKLGDFIIQKVNDQLYWVAPLLHTGYFKWMNNREGTTGYVMISATNERDVKLVQEVEGKLVRIKYQTGAYGMDRLRRHLYFNGYMSRGITDFTLEIDDKGIPYWVVTIYEKKIGFGGADVTGVLTVHAQTGEIKEYTLDKIPEWIDRVQPHEFIESQLDNWGEYVKGYWNFANEGKLMTTPGTSLVYGSDNKAYWYTGMTSVGSDEGTVGFVLVDTRTKEAVWYKQTGATEQAAQQSAMGKVQEKGYFASFPITYNINGIPTYVMSLKDNAGLVKMMAMVSVEDYTIVGIGNNINEALRDYKNALNSKGVTNIPGNETNSFQTTAKVLRVSRDIRNGNTDYYLLLQKPNNKIFIGSSIISSEIPLTEVGDSVLVKYDEQNGEIINIIGFDNLNINLKK